MSSSYRPVSSPLKSLSRFLPSKFRQSISVCGLLGSTNLGHEQDHWMAVDFLVLRELIGATEHLSSWLCGVPIRLGRETYLLGNPDCGRILFEPTPFETIHQPLKSLRAAYIIEVSKRAAALHKGDILVLVLVGHGEHGGLFIIGDGDQESYPLEKSELETCVREAKGTIWLITTACYSGAWESPHWSLLAATEEDQESPSISVSGSGKYCGGFFVNALLAEHADECNLSAHCPGSVDEQGNRGQQHPHDFGPEKSVKPSRSTQKRSLCDVREWIHRWRDKIGRLYTTANICFQPCPQSEPHTIPFRSLHSSKAAFHRFKCVGPSPHDDGTGTSVSESVHAASHPSKQPTLSLQDEQELFCLAKKLLQNSPLHTANNTATLLHCYALFRGDDSLSPEKKLSLLVNLKSRKRCQELALAIAKNLGWSAFVDQLGIPEVEQACHSAIQSCKPEAEKHGCHVLILVGRGYSTLPRYMGAANWLSRIWYAAGRPTISAGDWEQAVVQSHLDVGQQK